MRKKTSFLERAMIAATPYDRVRRFLVETIWQIDPKTRSRFYERWGIYSLRVVYLVGRGLVSSRTQLQASALTYTTMLALVPAFAVVFSLFQAFGGLEGTDAKVKSFLIRLLAPSPEQESLIRENLDTLVSNANTYVQSGSGIAVISLIFLVLTVVSLLSSVEKTMNDVWNVKRSRSVIQKFVTYWALATLGPILLGVGLVTGSSVNSWLGDYSPAHLMSRLWKDPPPHSRPVNLRTELESGRVAERQLMVSHNQVPPEWTEGDRQKFVWFKVYPEEDESARFTSFMMVVIAFTLLYAFMPNTRVKLKPAILGGVIAAFAWNMSRWGLATSSSSLVKYNTIYGGLATIPIMMFWLYVSWMIVILGADVTFAIQNISSQGKEELAEEASPRCRETVALRLMAAIGDAFDRGAEPPGVAALAQRLGAPVTLTSEIVFHLCEDRLLREIDRPDDPGYLPGRPLERISIHDVVSSLHERDGTDFTLEGGVDAGFIAESLARARLAHERVAGEVTFDHVVRSLRSGSAVAPAPAVAPASAVAPAPALRRESSGRLTPVKVLERAAVEPAPGPVAAPAAPAARVATTSPPSEAGLAAALAALKAAESTLPPPPSAPVGAGGTEQLAALLDGASPDEPLP